MKETIKVVFCFSDRGFCKTIFKEFKRRRYFIRMDDGEWYTCYPSNGYYECSSQISGKNIEIVNDQGVVINCPLSLDDYIKEKGQKIAKQYGLIEWEEWHKELMLEKERIGNKDDKDNWLYDPKLLKTLESEVIDEFEYFGITFEIVKNKMTHYSSNKSWFAFTIIKKNDKYFFNFDVGFLFA